MLAKILRPHAYVPPKRELGDQSIVVPPKSMGGNLCILFKAQDDEAKRVFVSCSKPKIEAKRLTVFDCENLSSLKGNISSIHFK